MKKFGKLLLLFLFFMVLAACSSNSTTTSSTSGTSESPVADFAEIIENATEYSYEYVFTSVNDGVTEVFTWGFARQGNVSAFSMEMSGVPGKTILLETPEFYYYITIDGTEKSAMKMTNDGEDSGLATPPDFGYITDLNPSLYDVTVQQNVMVNGTNTTCYSYRYDYTSGEYYTYKYYVKNDGMVVKVEWDYDGDRWTAEFRNFKTSNIDTSLLTIPTEAAGYEITDLTEY